MNDSVSYILAASIKELFPGAEIEQICSTEKSFFCDLVFPGEFTPSILSLLEERMRQWAQKELTFNVLTMMPSNAAQMLDHHGDKTLAFKVRKEEGEVTLLQLDHFFFRLEGEAPSISEEVPFFKLVCFWPLKRGIRILGVGAASKDLLKKQAQELKTVKNVQKTLEECGYVSWIGESLVWEAPAEAIKAKIKKKILQLYQDFDRVTLPELDEKQQKKLLLEWIKARKRGGVQFQKKRLPSKTKEPWDESISPCDHGWASGDINSYLHLITKFLTIFSFDYEIVKADKGRSLKFQVIDRLGRRWTMSTLELDVKQGLVQVTLCISYERCIALLADRCEGKIVINEIEVG
jgi:hypothetical protein